MSEPKDTKVVANVPHGDSYADTRVVAESVLGTKVSEDVEEHEDGEVARIQKNDRVEPGP